VRKGTIKGSRRARKALHRTPPAARIKSALRRRIDRSALEIASGRPAVPPAVPALLAGGGIGALLTYFLDPRRGKGRRAKARDRTAAVARRGLRKSETQLRRIASRAAGTAERVARHEPSAKKVFDDAGLAAKVETELFGNPRIPKGALNVNVEDGIVIVRGQVERSDQVEMIERAIRRIEGVGEVRNLLHTPGTPAPNKAAALRASAQPGE
jgi:BON domain-containing protein